AALSHPHAEAQERRGAARQLLRVRAAAARSQARPDPLAVPTQFPLQPGEARDLLQAAATRLRASCGLWPAPRPSPEKQGVAEERSAPQNPSRDGDPARELPRPGL